MCYRDGILEAGKVGGVSYKMVVVKVVLTDMASYDKLILLEK